MKLNEINIRDPFVVAHEGKYYMYGTRAKDFGIRTGGFDVYISESLNGEWSNPIAVFDSEKYGLNKGANWAPEVHFYNGKYYMLASFVQENGLRGTYILVGESLLGQFEPLTGKAITPDGWECIDGTLHIEGDIPYIVFCHEHTQISNGTICYQQLSNDLTSAVGNATLIFDAKSVPWVVSCGTNYITDGPYLYRTKKGKLIMIWSSFKKRGWRKKCYVEAQAISDNDSITGAFRHIELIEKNDGGHGMLFHSRDGLMLALHSPNNSGSEKPVFMKIEDTGARLIKI